MTTTTPSAPLQTLMSRVFAADPLAWAMHSGRVLHPMGTRRFLPYPYQEILLRDASPRRLVLKARQTGISQTIALEARHVAEHQPGSTTLFLSRTEKMAADLVRYARAAATVGTNRILQDNALALSFSNGGRIIAEAATKSAGRGFAASNVYLDEVAFHEYDAEVWRAVQPTVSTGGRITVLSTPNGRQNVFYLMWAGEYGDWSKHLVHWRDCPVYDDAWFARTRPGFTGRDWASEYECDFVESGGAAFPAALCERVYDRRLPHDDPRTWVSVPGTTTYWDLGARQDATVGVTVGHVGGKLPVVAFLRMDAPNEWPAIERAIAERIARYPDGRHVIESNGIGDPFLAKCREDGLPVEDFLVTARSKQDMLRSLVLACEQDRFRHGSPALYSEMLRYEYADTKLVQDAVIAASGAVHIAEQGGILLHV